MHVNDILSHPDLQGIKARFNAKFIRKGPDECWPWTAATMARGYGKLGVDNQLIAAHVLAYLFAKGPMPEGYGRFKGSLVCKHECDNRKCVNPKHIVVGTQLSNVRDAVARKLFVFGFDRKHTKLSEEQVAAIRADPRMQKEIAADYGIRQGHVSRIKNRVRRQHVC